MRRQMLFPMLAPVLAMSLAAGCGLTDDAATSDEDYEVVPEGKEDNYRSPSAIELSAKADATVTLDERARSLPEAERAAQARDLVSAKLLQIGWFLNLYVADKEPEDANKGYGGFHAMARSSSVKALSITPVDAVTYRFNFEATIAAQNDFLKVLPGTPVSGGGEKIDLKMGRVSNADLLGGKWQSSYDVHAWDPRSLSEAQVETLPMVIKKLERSANAWLDTKRLYADGKLEVGAQFGWDYNDGRQDLANAEQLYDELLAIGFKSPVGSFAALKLDSAPLTRAGTYDGKPVTISVKLVHPGMVASASTDALKLRNALLDLLATKEVVLFNGHAGVSGRLLPADFRSTSAGNILPTEYPSLKLFDGYQIFLIEGCQTYARFTDGFKQNPAKRGPNGELVNMDIVTSTSYTWTSQGAESMEAILWPLVGQSATRNIKPPTWDDVLRTMNAPPNQTAFMGVNGIDGDPHAHPYAKSEKLGRSCTSNAFCGGDGNVCLRDVSGKRVCGTVCIDDAGCSTGYRCATVASSGTISTRACVAR